MNWPNAHSYLWWAKVHQSLALWHLKWGRKHEAKAATYFFCADQCAIETADLIKARLNEVAVVSFMTPAQIDLVLDIGAAVKVMYEHIPFSCDDSKAAYQRLCDALSARSTGLRTSPAVEPTSTTGASK